MMMTFKTVDDNYLLPVNPRDIGSEWQCQGCEKTIRAEEAVSAVMKMEAKIRAVSSVVRGT